jgi:multicomponent K+:H+ antiporter subunit E
MKRWLPSPLLSASLAALWLLLNDSASPGHLLIALVVALLAPVLVARLRPAGGRLRKPMVLARLIVHVGGDVVVSALQVAAGVLRGRTRPPRAGFVLVPLDLRDAHGLAALAMITTVVPGTVWSELAPDRSAVLLHVFDLQGEAEFIAHYKARYERPLTEIFG